MAAFLLYGGFNILDFNFFMPTRVISGKGCFLNSEDTLKSLGGRCLVVTGEGSAKKSGAFDDAQAVLKKAGIEFIVFDKIAPNPLLSSCYEAGSAARKFRADFILGIGGGSALDAAKAAAVFAGNSSFSPNDIYKHGFSKALPIVLVGTTAGTGSEVTATAVLTVDDQRIKKSITHKCCYAAISFADYSYTKSCPYNLTVTAALDALCHAVEGYYSARAGDIARAASLEAVKLLWPNLLWLRGNPDCLPDDTAREQLYYGSLWAGIALNLSGTGFPHPAGYPLSLELGISHGKACAVFLPDYIKRNAPAAQALTLKLLAVLGCGVDSFCETVETLTAIRGVKFSEEKCEEYAKQLEGRANLTNAVHPITVEEVLSIYKKLFAN
jgi:alcohol dehydrogenase class IV